MGNVFKANQILVDKTKPTKISSFQSKVQFQISPEEVEEGEKAKGQLLNKLKAMFSPEENSLGAGEASAEPLS
ncbi:hypothetical protein HYY75_05395, partial [bacterium]|nr:hypothetical protein [bacterium]